MPMNDAWLLAWTAGGALGLMFFGGLWWTVRKGAASRRPALWFFSSLLLRMGLTMAGFYGVSGGQWERMLLCLLGFVMARPLVIWLTRCRPPNSAAPTRESRHAPEP
jgi:F1F0 ATPase subunit 2